MNNTQFYKALVALCLSIAAWFTSEAQVFPAEGAELNYRVIRFSTASIDGKQGARLEIALGNFDNVDSFRKHLIISSPWRDKYEIAEVPAFGTQYTWSETVGGHGSGKLHHFRTGVMPGGDTSVSRVRVSRAAEKWADGYVLLDGNKAMYDMKGNPVWYLPQLDPSFNDGTVVRDMKRTGRGTITLLAGNDAYEINYDGKVLWKAPNDGQVSGDRMELYHHELTRTDDGHYWVMGAEMKAVYVQYGAKGDSQLVIGREPAGAKYRVVAERALLGTLMEYDQQGKVLWQYHTSDYFNGSDVLYCNWPYGKFNAHDNAFFFDRSRDAFYMSFRDINRVVKFHYPDGKVLAVFGERFGPGGAVAGAGLFCRQHSCRVNSRGDLYLFDNNDCHTDEPAKILVISQPDKENSRAEKLWEYPCPGEIVKNGGGGNVCELADGSYFVSSCNPNTTIFIVGADKIIYWSAMAEKKNGSDGKWEPIGQYRGSFIPDKHALVQIISGPGK